MRELLAVMGTADAFPTVFGATLDELEATWLERVAATYARKPDRVELRRTYRALPALDDLNPCVPGRDFDVASGSSAPLSTPSR